MAGFSPFGLPQNGLGASLNDAGHVDTIQRLMHLDSDRVAAIQRMMELDADRLAALDRMTALDAQRLATIAALETTVRQYQELEAERIDQINRLQSVESARVGQLSTMQEVDSERVDKISQLLTVDEQRVGQIGRMLEVDTQRIGEIQRLQAADAARIEQINKQQEAYAGLLSAYDTLKQRFYESDGMAISDRNTAFMDEPVFAEAWRQSFEANKEGWPEGVPDLRWRSAIILWAGRNALHLKGDFVECGVHTGLFSLFLLRALGKDLAKRKFYLFDTYNGIPLEGLKDDELSRSQAANQHAYRDVWDIAQRNFAPFKNARLVRGKLPATLADVKLGPIAYLSIDLNVAETESAVIERLWKLLVPGAIVVIDDYGWLAASRQYDMWNAFARKVGHSIAPLPTGQGLLIKF